MRIQTSYRLDSDLYELLRKESFDTRLSMSDIINKLLREYFTNKGNADGQKDNKAKTGTTS